MNKGLYFAFIFLVPFVVDGGEIHPYYTWYCPRCGISDGYNPSIDQIIENRVPEKPSYNSRNCADAHGSTYCYWVLNRGTIKILLDDITKYRETKEKVQKHKEWIKENPVEAFKESTTNKFSNAAMLKDPYINFLQNDESKEKLNNFNTDLVAPRAPVEVLKK